MCGPIHRTRSWPQNTRVPNEPSPTIGQSRLLPNQLATHLWHNASVKLALIGYGNVGRALAQLLRRKRADFPFTVTGIHTLRHGTAVDPAGLPDAPEFGPRMA